MARRFELRTQRLHLVRLTEAHLDDLVALDADPEVMRFITDGQPNTRQIYLDDLLPRMVGFDDEPHGFAAAYEQGAFVGWFHRKRLRGGGGGEERWRRDLWT